MSDEKSWKLNTENLVQCALPAGVGLLGVLASLGVLPWPSGTNCTRAAFCNPQNWQIFTLSMVFVLAGVSLIIPPHWTWTSRLVRIGFLTAFFGGILGSALVP